MYIWCDVLDCMKVFCTLMDMKLMLVDVSFIHCLIALSIMLYNICFILYVNFPLAETLMMIGSFPL